MKALLLACLSLFLISCATSTRQTDALVKNHQGLPEKVKLTSVPFIEQKANHCGPASMAMVMRHAGQQVPLKKLTSMMYTRGMKGTFQSEMLGVARRQGMLTFNINSMPELLRELSEGHPVLVFQNLGLGLFPQWHYAVAVGHDLHGPDIILHSGSEQFKKGDMRFFERTWKLGGYWGLLVLNPGELSVTSSETDHVKAAAALEELEKFDEAFISYESILKRWPKSLLALVGLGNVSYARKQYGDSVKFLKRAHALHPESPIVKNNLQVAMSAFRTRGEGRQ